MAAISDRAVFEEAYKTVLDDFTEDELAEVGKAAAELRAVPRRGKQARALPKGEMTR